MTDAVEAERLLELLLSGLAARVLGRHFALRPAGTRDERLFAELHLIVRESGRQTLAEKLATGMEKDRTARRASHHARVAAASQDVARAAAVRRRILQPQQTITRRPALLERLAAMFEEAHDIARMVGEYRVERPRNLPDDGSLLQRARRLRILAGEIREERSELDGEVFLGALAAELDAAASEAESLQPGVERILALERCFEAAVQISATVRSRGEPESIVRFAAVFARLVRLNQEIGVAATRKAIQP